MMVGMGIAAVIERVRHIADVRELTSWTEAPQATGPPTIRAA